MAHGLSDEVAESGPARRSRSGRFAVALYVVLQPLAVVYWMLAGRSLWFFFDEWDFLATRRAGSIDDLFRAHHGHWSTLPILVYRALWTAVGVHSYRPYLLLAITLHLVVGGLLRAVMRRANVSPWTATGAAALFVFFGSGWQNILEAFQITFVGSLAFGLAQLLLADHDGPLDRRDWLGFVAGLAALMCSGVGLTMVFVVGVSVLLRRGWRFAAFHVVPLALIYLLWSAIVHPHATLSFSSPRSVFDDAFALVRQSFAALGGVHALGIVVAVVLVVGLYVLVHDLHARLGSVAPVPAMLAGALFFAVTTEAGRADTSVNTITPSRWIYVVAALVLPALAVAADTLARRSRLVAALLCTMLAITVIANVRTVKPSTRNAEVVDQAARRTLLAIPHLPIARRLPPNLHPDLAFAPDVTIGWLLAASAQGQLPGPGALSPNFVDTETLSLAFRRLPHAPGSATCVAITHPTSWTVHAGDRLAPAPHQVIELRYGQADLLLGSPSLPATAALAGPINLQVVPIAGAAHSQLCISS